MVSAQTRLPGQRIDLWRRSRGPVLGGEIATALRLQVAEDVDERVEREVQALADVGGKREFLHQVQERQRWPQVATVEPPKEGDPRRFLRGVWPEVDETREIVWPARVGKRPQRRPE